VRQGTTVTLGNVLQAPASLSVLALSARKTAGSDDGSAGEERSDGLRPVQRPWGHYSTVRHGERFQVKELVVEPGGRLSLQMHHHRSEHWVVVRGTARVVRNDDEDLVYENGHVFIKAGMKHRLENPGKVTLHVIEVQSGCYLGEDDIVRFEDIYGRCAP